MCQAESYSTLLRWNESERFSLTLFKKFFSIRSLDFIRSSWALFSNYSPRTEKRFSWCLRKKCPGRQCLGAWDKDCLALRVQMSSRTSMKNNCRDLQIWLSATSQRDVAHNQTKIGKIALIALRSTFLHFRFNLANNSGVLITDSQAWACRIRQVFQRRGYSEC